MGAASGALRRVSARAFAEQIVESMHEGFALWGRHGRLVGWNQAAISITGWSFEEASSRFPTVGTDGLRELGDGRWVHLRRFPVRLLGLRYQASLFTDARQQVALREAYSRLDDFATTDPLTGLPNRVLAEDRLRASVNLARRDHRTVALLFVDLDDFKLVNDTLGHLAGDQVLRQVAQRLKASVRESDTATRVGGDEFVIILHTVTHPDDASLVARTILDNMAKPFLLGDQEVYLGASIGIAIFPDHGDDPATLIQHADLAMHRSKADGGKTFGFYAPVMSELSRERVVVAAELRRALERDELVVQYQPQVDLNTGSIVGAEALVRWGHPTRGLLMPDRFLSVAEEDGSIVEIDRIVLNAACHQVVQWDAEGLGLPLVSVNMAARTLVTTDVVRLVSDALAESGLAPDRLEVEVSEHVVTGLDGVGEKLAALRRLGVQVAIDDFGTGYSSLGQVKRFQVDTIKLDRSFVIDLTDEPDRTDVAVLRAVVRMAAEMGVRCVAEGVETVEQRKVLRHLDCRLVQGFLYSRPLAPELLGPMLRPVRQPV